MRLNPLLMEKLAGEEEYAAGRDLEELGAVKVAEEDRGMIRYTVAGPVPSAVTLTRKLVLHCDCDTFMRRGCCRHAVAVWLAADRNGVPERMMKKQAPDNANLLTEIILSKTCAELSRLIREGYKICRISVNVSAIELKEDAFCGDITRIIEGKGVPGDKIAIELTESRSDSDFILMKNKISKLRERGIKFYLDDFGTGYSNMERIMELPFDIIKFDRSMLLASGSSERSRQIVVSLAHMFAALNYAVLYEGVESDSDERLCLDMSASYLQGFKYSRPVPITELEAYCEH